MRKPFRKSYISAETLFIGAGLVVANIVLFYKVAIPYDAWWLKTTTVLGMVSFAGMIFVGFNPTLARIVFNLTLNLTLFSFFGWGFSHVGNLLVLPFAVAKWLNLGLYYFLLFGLLMGAALRMWLHSLGNESKPIAVVCGCVIAILCSMGALSLEAKYIAGDAYDYVAKTIQRLPARVTVADLHTMVFEQTAEQLATFEPGGTLGYIRWARNDGEIKVVIPGHGSTMTYVLRQRGRSFTARIVLSVILLAVGMCYMAVRRRAAKRPSPMFPEGSGDNRATDSGYHSHSMVAGGFEEMS